jgi:hypothetical protein
MINTCVAWSSSTHQICVRYSQSITTTPDEWHYYHHDIAPDTSVKNSQSEDYTTTDIINILRDFKQVKDG